MGAIRTWSVCVVMLVGCIDSIETPETSEVVQEQVAWDSKLSKMPMWGCDLPETTWTVPGTNRTYAPHDVVQGILDAQCNTCHDGQQSKPATPLSDGQFARLYRWEASFGVATANYAAQIVEALHDDGDGMKSSHSSDGAMWNFSAITKEEREKVSDHFSYCADHPSHLTKGGFLSSPKIYNHYLIGRSYLTGINWPNPAPAGDPGINTCNEPLSLDDKCVVDEQGLELPESSAEMDRFYAASNQGSLDTLGKWIAMRTPKFIRMPGESIDAFRDRTDTAVYYNQNELGLAREMWCGTWPTGCSNEKGGTAPRCNLACGVTNYGHNHNDVPNALATATRRRNEKNTVVISYSLPLAQQNNPINNKPFGAGYAVQFGAFGPTGKRSNAAQLDYQGPRPASYICTNCHGGWYDPTVHLVYQAKLLPANPHEVRYTDSPEFPTGTHDSQLQYGQTEVQSKLQAINELMYNWVKKQEDSTSSHYTANEKDRILLPAQLAWLEAMYCWNVAGCSLGNGNGGPHVLTTTARHVAPTNANSEGWQTWGAWPCSDPRSQYVRDIYHSVIQPYCVGCHNAFIDAPVHLGMTPSTLGNDTANADFGGSNPLSTFHRFMVHWPKIEKYFIRNGRMPHAEHTLKAFWTRPLTIDGTMTGTPLPTYDCVGNVNGYLSSDGTRTGTPFPSPKWLLYDRMAKPGVTGLVVTEPMADSWGDSCNVKHPATQWPVNMCGDPDHSGRACVNGACVDRCDADVHCPVWLNSPPSENPNRTQCVASTNTCEPCGRAGQKYCVVGDPCDPQLNPGCNVSSALRCESGTSEFTSVWSLDSTHTYGDVNRCLINLVDRNPKEVDSDLTFPGLIPTDQSGARLPTSNGTPGVATTSYTSPVPTGAVPIFAGFTLSSSTPSAGLSGTYCTNNCKERVVDGLVGQYFDSSVLGGGYIDFDFGRNRTVYAIQLQRDTTASTLLDDTNVYYQTDYSTTWTQIPAANGYGAGSYTVNDYPAGYSVWIKVPVNAGPIRKIRIRRFCPYLCQKQIRVAEVKIYGY